MSAGGRTPAPPRGALVVSGIAVALLFVGWLLFYFCLFLPRGAID